MIRMSRLDLSNIRAFFKVLLIVLLLSGGFSFFATVLLPQKDGAIGILRMGLGLGLLAVAFILLRHWNWARFLPKSKTSRVYLGVVYGILLTWFVTCFAWGEAFRGSVFVPPRVDILQVRDLLTLCAMPALAGMSVDLLIAKWPEKQYQPVARAAGLVLLALFILVVGGYLVL